VFANRGDIGMSPFAKLHAISAVYFPEFETDIGELEIVARAYERWMIDAEGKWLRNEPDYADRFSEAFDPYWKQVVTVLGKLKEYAKREFQ
jgi:hypothetical protein